MAKLLIIIGALLLAVGALLTYFPRALSWFGNLPGDVRIERPDAAFYFPITSMIVISIVVTLLIDALARR